MANKKLFQAPLRHEAKVDTVNPAGGTAYSKSDEVALAQLATTGTFADTFYAKAEQQVAHMLELADKVSAEFLAKLAVYARNMGKMKDMPAYIVTFLLVKAKKDETYAPYAEAAFKAVVRNGRMIRNVTLFMRSGTVLGNKSLGSRTQRLISQVLNAASDRQIINWSVGNDPSLADVIKLARPNPEFTPNAAGRRGLYAWVIGKNPDVDNKKDHPQTAPPLLGELLAFQKDPVNNPVPNVEFRLLTGVDMPEAQWVAIARNASYMQTRMNLATFHRHGVFKDPVTTKLIADRLRDKEAIRKSGVFPYQQWVAASKLRTIPTFPHPISDAMEDAVDVSLDNIPSLQGEVIVAVDVSGSMSCPVTGYGGGGRSSTVRCVDAAALVAAGVKRKHPNARIIAFDTKAREVSMSHRDSVVTLAASLAKFHGGGTNCGAALQLINHWVGAGSWASPDLLIMVSDNQSWHMHEYSMYGTPAGHTPALEAWNKIYARNRKAKFICLDMHPSLNQQVPDAPNRATVGGFSDETFQMFKDIQDGVRGEDVWLQRINAIELDL